MFEKKFVQVIFFHFQTNILTTIKRHARDDNGHSLGRKSQMLLYIRYAGENDRQ
jgi:hypothetical protein